VSDAEAPLVRVERTGGTCRLVLDSPHNRNALSARLRRELAGGLRQAFANPDVRVVLLTHTGSVFCAGADLSEVHDPPPEHPDDASLADILDLVWTAPRPVVARIAGKVRAGGLGLVAAAQVAIGSTDADFALTEVRIGVVPALISAPLLRVLSPRDAQELFVSGEVFGAERAARAGLLTRAVSAESLDAEIEQLLDALGRGAPSAVTATLGLLQNHLGPGADWAALTALSEHHFGSAEAREGVAAWRDKRNASWVPAESTHP
jgi:methylglutaconyl-CoA hydratase